jgi:uncharacterized C2H2 Zn-finger protein
MQVYPTNRKGRVQLRCDYCGSLFNRAESQIRLRGGEHAFCCKHHEFSFKEEMAAVRFWNSINFDGDNGCWIWVGCTSEYGYGLISWKWPGRKSRSTLSHRVSWLLNMGEFDYSLDVLHKCDNPPCVRPSHLFLGTAADNMHDMDAKGRRRSKPSIGEKHPMSKLRDRDVVLIKSMLSAGDMVHDVARCFGVSPHTIYKIRSGQLWSHVRLGDNENPVAVGAV